MAYRTPSFEPTEPQKKWLEDEKKRTGNHYAVILRMLIQEKIDNAK